MAEDIAAHGEKRIGLSIPVSAAKLIREALDSHVYWQLTDPQYRRDSFSMDPCSDLPENREDIAKARVLIESIKRAIEMVGGEEPTADPPSASPPPEAGPGGPGLTAILDDFMGIGEDDAMRLLDFLADESSPAEVRAALWRSMRFATLHYFVTMAVSTSLLTQGNIPPNIVTLHAGAAAELDRRFPNRAELGLAEVFRTYVSPK